jgi:deoxyribodipyrimidine photolyase-related protein
LVAPRLILVLGDQLTPTLSALAAGDRERDVVVMAEARDEATYVRHHKKKIALIFASMRKFAAELEGDGWRVAYGRYDDTATSRSICGELMRRHAEFAADGVIATECGEWRLRQALAACPLRIAVLPDGRFITPVGYFDTWAAGLKMLRKEFFYREMQADGSPNERGRARGRQLELRPAQPQTGESGLADALTGAAHAGRRHRRGP